MVMLMAHSDGADIRLGSLIVLGNLTNIKSMMRCT